MWSDRVVVQVDLLIPPMYRFRSGHRELVATRLSFTGPSYQISSRISTRQPRSFLKLPLTYIAPCHFSEGVLEERYNVLGTTLSLFS